jgi:hypothetical protein
VHWTYTNIYLLEVHNRILGGQLLGDEELTARGKERLRAWAARTRENGAPHEFNSPTYAAVQISALAAIVQHTAEEEARALALEMEEYLWRHVASHWHAPTRQLAGPHSRAYRRDVAGAAGFLKVVLYRVLGDERLLAETPYYTGPVREGEIPVALTEYHPPPDALAMLNNTSEREVRECASRELGMDLVTYLRPEFALGTLSRKYALGDPPEPWPQENACTLHWVRGRAPGYGVLYSRYLINDRKAGAFVHDAQRVAVDLWEEGIFRAAQRGPTAIVAYGTTPRAYRPVTGMRMDVRLMGPDAETVLLTADGPYTGGEMAVPEGRPVIIADGDAYMAIVPLTADRLTPDTPGPTLWQDGEETVLSIFNYRGPPALFWEYRSLGGPFYKGNVRNGFALTAAPRNEFPSPEAFLEHALSLPLEDTLTGSRRLIRFAGAELEYDLRDLRLAL